jgi:hypothetical protein
MTGRRKAPSLPRIRAPTPSPADLCCFAPWPFNCFSPPFYARRKKFIRSQAVPAGTRRYSRLAVVGRVPSRGVPHSERPEPGAYGPEPHFQLSKSGIEVPCVWTRCSFGGVWTIRMSAHLQPTIDTFRQASPSVNLPGEINLNNAVTSSGYSLASAD